MSIFGADFHAHLAEFMNKVENARAEMRDEFPKNPPLPGHGMGDWMIQARVHGVMPKGRFYDFHILSDLSIGMCARRKAWPKMQTIFLGKDDVLLLMDGETVIGPWQPKQEDLMVGDWITGD